MIKIKSITKTSLYFMLGLMATIVALSINTPNKTQAASASTTFYSTGSSDAVSIQDIPLGGSSPPNSFGDMGGTTMSSTTSAGQPLVVSAGNIQVVGREFTAPSEVCSTASLTSLRVTFDASRLTADSGSDGVVVFVSMDGETSVPIISPAAGGNFNGGLMPNSTGIGNPAGMFDPGMASMSGTFDAQFDLSGYNGSDINNMLVVLAIDNNDSLSNGDYSADSPEVTVTYDDSVCGNNSNSNSTANKQALTYPEPVKGKTVTLSLPDTVTNASVSAVNPSSVATDGTLNYPAGLTSFQFDTTLGNTETVTLYYDLPGDASDYQARKYNTTNQTFTDIDNASIIRTTYQGSSVLALTYDITDGGVLDQDNEANGTIVDPVGLATATNDSELSDTGQNTILLTLSSITLIIASITILLRLKSKKSY